MAESEILSLLAADIPVADIIAVCTKRWPGASPTWRPG